jgi:hypothetical protein
MLAWATAPIAMVLIRQVWRVAGRALNPVLAGAARLSLWFALAFGIGIAL